MESTGRNIGESTPNNRDGISETGTGLATIVIMAGPHRVVVHELKLTDLEKLFHLALNTWPDAPPALTNLCDKLVQI